MPRSVHSILTALVAATIVLAVYPLTAQPFVPLPRDRFPADTLDSSGAAWVDLDGDGDDDLVVAVIGGPLAIFRNDGRGTFVRQHDGELPNLVQSHFGVAAADFNNDGRIDLAIANGGPRIGSLIYRQAATGDFIRHDLWPGSPEIATGWSPAWGDYDGDGWVDLAIAHPSGFSGPVSTGNLLYRNRGDGSFERAENTAIMRAPLGPYTTGSWVDLDDDGDLDYVVAAGPATGAVAPDAFFINQRADSGRATFRRLTTAPLATDSLDGQVWNFVDIDNDGDLDAFVTNYAGPTGTMRNHLYRQGSAGWVRDTTAGALVTDRDTWLGQAWGDYDNDGDLDVVVATASRNQLARYYRNRGDGTFEHAGDTPFGTTRGAAWGIANSDIDGDGDLDLFISAKSIAARGIFPPDAMYENRLAAGRHWVALDLVGTRSNRSAIGATVHVTATIGGRAVTQRRTVSTQDTFGGHNSLRVHVGLGDATRITSIEVRWPSGARDRWTGLAPDARYVATEGATAPQRR